MPAMLLGSLAYSQTKLTTKAAKVLIHGNSTMHKWSSEAEKVNVVGDFVITDGNFKKINSATVKIESKSIKSNHDSDLMDERTHKTINTAKFPYITYEYLNTISTDVKGEITTIKVNGNLTISGVTKPTDLTLKITNLPNGDIDIKGGKKILMSSHGIKPPSFVAGALKVNDEIEISFDVILKK